MPGVPSGRGCEACRKQKKKCDQITPSCSRCVRLQLICVGAGQKRYKFMGQDVSHLPTSDLQKTDWRKGGSCTFVVKSVPKSPSNQLSSLIGAYVAAVRPSTDLRYNLAWTYGGYQTDVPLRLGTNEALDAAASALVEAHSNYCSGRRNTPASLAKYSLALRTLRFCLDDPVKAGASESLCAVTLLLVCQVFLGISGGNRSGHSEGMVRMLIARGSFSARDQFEAKLLAALRGSVICEGLVNNRIKLFPQQWKSLAYNPLDKDSYEGKLMRSLCMVPYFIESRARKDKSPYEDAEVLAEILAGYQMLKPLLAELKARFVEVANKPALDATLRNDAYTVRTYGLSLWVAVVLNCVLSAVYVVEETFRLEAESFSRDMLIISEVAKSYRPLGASYVPLCLSMAWVGTDEPSLKSDIENAVDEYQKHPSWGDMVKITVPDLEWTYKRLRLMNPDPPLMDS